MRKIRSRRECKMDCERCYGGLVAHCDDKAKETFKRPAYGTAKGYKKHEKNDQCVSFLHDDLFVSLWENREADRQTGTRNHKPETLSQWKNYRLRTRGNGV